MTDTLRKQKAKLLEFLKTLNVGSKNEKLKNLLLYSYQIREQTCREIIQLKNEGLTDDEIKEKFKSPV